MAKNVIWSLRAQSDRKTILAYWKERNKSDRYSKKLNLLFREAIRLISIFPQIGKLTDKENVRIKIVRDCLIIYEEQEHSIHILTIWSSYQDPATLGWKF